MDLSEDDEQNQNNQENPPTNENIKVLVGGSSEELAPPPPPFPDLLPDDADANSLLDDLNEDLNSGEFEVVLWKFGQNCFVFEMRISKVELGETRVGRSGFKVALVSAIASFHLVPPEKPYLTRFQQFLPHKGQPVGRNDASPLIIHGLEQGSFEASAVSDAKQLRTSTYVATAAPTPRFRQRQL